MSSSNGGSHEREAPRRPALRIGGMALGNGLFVHSGRFWAAAVRDDGGSIRVSSGTKRFPRSAEEGRVPLIRGLARLADGLLVIAPLKRALPQAVLPVEEPRIRAAVVISTLASLGLRAGRGSAVRRELQVMALGLTPLLLALRGSELAAYHGAEHKSIGEYELAVSRRGTSSAAAAAKEHERCGSNVVGPLLVTSFMSNVSFRMLRGRTTPLTALASGVVSLGAALEIFRWMSHHPEEPLSRVLAWPGRALQERVTTKEPSEAQMEVARAALAELLRLEDATQRSR